MGFIIRINLNLKDYYLLTLMLIFITNFKILYVLIFIIYVKVIDFILWIYLCYSYFDSQQLIVINFTSLIVKNDV